FTFEPNDTTCHVTVTPPPALVAGFTDTTSGHTAIFHDTTTGGTKPYTWLWDFGDGSPLTAANAQQNPVHTYSAAGTYTVTLMVTDSGTPPQTSTVSMFVTVM